MIPPEQWDDPLRDFTEDAAEIRRLRRRVKFWTAFTVAMLGAGGAYALAAYNAGGSWLWLMLGASQYVILGMLIGYQLGGRASR